MERVIVTGSGGLIGGEAVRFFHEKGFAITGIDNDMRAYFFGKDASTEWNRKNLEETLPRYTHYQADIRDTAKIEEIFSKYSSEIKLIVHTAAQPSHDWAAREPLTDFSINATGTLTMLEAARKHAPNAPFIFTSTNKVYGDKPNTLPLVELETRFELDSSHPFARYGIDESMSIDQSKHSLFGVSKVAADVLVQEYGRYFGMKTAVFRGGCLTGPTHSGTELHGFLSYLALCAVKHKPYTIYGYKGKQVRDNIHSKDLVSAFWYFFNKPRSGAVYNMGGSRHANISVLEAIDLIEKISGYKLDYTLDNTARSGDHIWYISDVRKFQSDYPEWHYAYDLEQTLREVIASAEKK